MHTTAAGVSIENGFKNNSDRYSSTLFKTVKIVVMMRSESLSRFYFFCLHHIYVRCVHSFFFANDLVNANRGNSVASDIENLDRDKSILITHQWEISFCHWIWDEGMRKMDGCVIETMCFRKHFLHIR